MKKLIALLCLLALCCSLCACNRNKLSDLTAVSYYVFIEDSLSQAEAKAIGPKLSQIPGVESVMFVSAADAFEDFKQDHQDSAAFEGVTADMLRHRFIINAIVSDAEALIAQIEAIPGVAEVDAPLGFITTFE